MKYLCLFRTSSISFKTFVYRLVHSLAFGINDDSKRIAEFKVKAPELVHHDNKWYISDLHDFQGIRMTCLRRDEDKKE